VAEVAHRLQDRTQGSAVGRRRRLTKRINWEKTVIFLCLAYLVTFIAWGEITDLRLESQASQLRQAVKAEDRSNEALKSAIRSLQGKGGENAAVQSELGLVPKGQIQVIVEPQSAASR